MNAYKNNPALRTAVRAAVVAILTYLATALRDNDFSDWKNVLYGIGSALAYAIIGVLTPVEPKVGVKTTVSP